MLGITVSLYINETFWGEYPLMKDRDTEINEYCGSDGDNFLLSTAL